MRLHYAGQPGEGFGWGVCNTNLRRALGEWFDVTDSAFIDVAFIPLVDHDFNPCSSARAKINLAYTFFEFDLGPNAAANAAKYDVVFCGSTWCLERMRERGITNGEVLIQGVDHSIFFPTSRVEDGVFRVFSGGKFEWRKGQDLIIAAFARFAQRHPEAHLVCSWHNPWPQLIGSMAQSPHINVNAEGKNQEELYARLLEKNGVPPSQFTVLPHLNQREIAWWMSQTDIGLFPNRCEGGTNLVLMEYLSCGRPAIANLKTGHADLVGAPIIEIPAELDSRKWAEQDVMPIVGALDLAYYGSVPQHACPVWTWENAAHQIHKIVHERIH